MISATETKPKTMLANIEVEAVQKNKRRFVDGKDAALTEVLGRRPVLQLSHKLVQTLIRGFGCYRHR